MHTIRLAEFYLNKGDFDAALENYQLAFEVDPEFEWATRNLAVAKHQKKMASEDALIMPWSSPIQKMLKIYLIMECGSFTILNGSKLMIHLLQQ